MGAIQRTWIGVERVQGELEQQGRSHPFHLRFQRRGLFAEEIRAKATISAPMQEVWRVLIDFDNYSSWNSFTPQIEGELQVGSPVILHVDMPHRSKSVRTEWVNLVEPGRTICWGMHMGHPLLLCANRWQMLKPLDDNKTEYETVDHFSGVLTPLVMLLYGEPTRLGFQSVADGLKSYVESNIAVRGGGE